MQFGGRAAENTSQIHVLEVETKTKGTIVRQRYAAGAKHIMTIQLIKLLMISSSNCIHLQSRSRCRADQRSTSYRSGKCRNA